MIRYDYFFQCFTKKGERKGTTSLSCLLSLPLERKMSPRIVTQPLAGSAEVVASGDALRAVRLEREKRIAFFPVNLAARRCDTLSLHSFCSILSPLSFLPSPPNQNINRRSVCWATRASRTPWPRTAGGPRRREELPLLREEACRCLRRRRRRASSSSLESRAWAWAPRTSPTRSRRASAAEAAGYRTWRGGSGPRFEGEKEEERAATATARKGGRRRASGDRAFSEGPGLPLLLPATTRTRAGERRQSRTRRPSCGQLRR